MGGLGKCRGCWSKVLIDLISGKMCVRKLGKSPKYYEKSRNPLFSKHMLVFYITWALPMGIL